jgi:protein tyrosine/serine phosphatase
VHPLARRLSRYTVALAVLTAAAAPARAQTPVATALAAAHDISRIHIDNFGQVNDRYFRGGHPAGHDYADLAAVGIKTIVNLTSDDADVNERSMAAAAGMKYFQIPMTMHQPPTAAQIAQFLAIVNDKGDQPVYVHCVGGRHRTGVMTAIYRMTNDGWSAARAFAEMKQYKFGADFLHAEFKAFVLAYQAPLAAAASAAAPPVAAKAGG